MHQKENFFNKFSKYQTSLYSKVKKQQNEILEEECIVVVEVCGRTRKQEDILVDEFPLIVKNMTIFFVVRVIEIINLFFAHIVLISIIGILLNKPTTNNFVHFFCKRFMKYF